MEKFNWKIIHTTVQKFMIDFWKRSAMLFIIISVVLNLKLNNMAFVGYYLLARSSYFNF